VTAPHDDGLLDDLERLIPPDRILIAVMDLVGAVRRIIPRDGGLASRLDVDADGRWAWLADGDATAARSLRPGETLTVEFPGVGPQKGSSSFSVTLLRRPDDLLLMGTVGSSADDRVMNRMTQLNNETLNLYRELARQKAELEAAQQHLRVLRGLLPICSKCKKIRNVEGAWDDLESYIHDHSEAVFSHGLCPTCLKSLYPDDD